MIQTLYNISDAKQYYYKVHVWKLVTFKNKKSTSQKIKHKGSSHANNHKKYKNRT